MQPAPDNHIQYIELYATDLERIKKFYSDLFDWKFTDYGDTYTAFSKSGLEGGFEKVSHVSKGGPLVVLYHSNLEQVLADIQSAGGIITKEIFSFPGGRRFHFTDPSGNELAVWSETE